MQSKVVLFLLLLSLSNSVYSCTPCICGNWGWMDMWQGLKVADCRKSAKFTEIPKSIDSNVEALVLSGHYLTSVEQSHFTRYNKLQIYYAINNTINFVQRDAFKDVPNLQYVYLGGNNIKAFPTDVFSYTPKLKIMKCERNKLTTLQNNLFKNLLALKEIHLDRNEISVVQDQCFVNLPSLALLDLRFNNIQTINFNFHNDLQSLKSLYLSNNPWDCDDTLCKVINTVVGRKLWNTTAVPTCVNKGQKEWNQLKLEDFSASLISSTLTKVEEGHDVVLKCKYCFVSNISWILNDRELSPKYHYINDNSIISTITLTNIKKEETGYIKCHVNNCSTCKDVSTLVLIKEKTTTTLFPSTEDDFDVSNVTEEFDFIISSESTICFCNIILLITSGLILCTI